MSIDATLPENGFPSCRSVVCKVPWWQIRYSVSAQTVVPARLSRIGRPVPRWCSAPLQAMTALHSGKEKTLWWSFTGAISIYWTSDMWVPRVYVQGTTTAGGQSVVSAIYPFIKKKKCDVVQEIFQLLNFKERIRRILGDPAYPNPVIFLGTPFQEVLSRKSLAP